MSRERLESDRNFSHFYQRSALNREPRCATEMAAAERKRIILAFLQANLRNSNQTTCAVLESRLMHYGSLVDNRDFINNYAESTMAHMVDVRNMSLSMNSGLPDVVPRAVDLLQNLPGYSENDPCETEGPSVKDLHSMFLKMSIPPEPKKEAPKPPRKPSLFSSFLTRDEGSPQSRPSQLKRLNSDDIRGIPSKFAKTDEPIKEPEAGFKTASDQLKEDLKKNNAPRESSYSQPGPVKKTLGGKPKYSNKFVLPTRTAEEKSSDSRREEAPMEAEEVDERLKNIDPKMIELIRSEIMDSGSKIDWDDIAGLEFAKATIQEIVVWPMLRPDIFTGLRRPPKGILLFGPPGTGKTLIGKCIASQSKSTFFSISASSLTSKWIGDGEKMVRALFAVARVHQPSVVFIDEIDSLLTQRSETEHESSRRIKTEFLVQLDGAATGEEDRILIIGATNRPQELDEAARRRLVKRLYIPLPEQGARRQIVENLVRKERNSLSDSEIEEIAGLTEGYSGADMRNLCQEASLGPIRSIEPSKMFNITPDEVRPLNVEDFTNALKRVRSSVSPKDLKSYVTWDQTYGSGF